MQKCPRSADSWQAPNTALLARDAFIGCRTARPHLLQSKQELPFSRSFTSSAALIILFSWIRIPNTALVWDTQFRHFLVITRYKRHRLLPTEPWPFPHNELKRLAAVLD